VIESGAEPYIAKNILTFNYKIFGQSEAIALFIKTIFLYILIEFQLAHPLISFALSHLFYSTLLMG